MTENATKKLLLSSWKIIPHFPCTSVAATVKFYTESLHFTLGGVHPDDCPQEEAEMCSVAVGKKADANIYLFRKPGPFEPSAAMIAMGTNQLDKYYQLLLDEGKVEISVPIKDQPWGYRQFEIKDVDGNRIQFFKFLEGGNPGTPDGGDASLLLE
ncbi:hypothetical protein H072_4769 [Dactylellina haptotyla CBS 200.50]|uniref:VOC domain-containing protein n=1 Tax=Dactylellina haptotyla (strain CBS 200.50) TaxID=1284197 RepID=S8AEC0_DACHA|nr:hypothetical protein H072_4769 [Dactylellina haptotyla CBS 200.50]